MEIGALTNYSFETHGLNASFILGIRDEDVKAMVLIFLECSNRAGRRMNKPLGYSTMSYKTEVLLVQRR